MWVIKQEKESGHSGSRAGSGWWGKLEFMASHSLLFLFFFFSLSFLRQRQGREGKTTTTALQRKIYCCWTSIAMVFLFCNQASRSSSYTSFMPQLLSTDNKYHHWLSQNSEEEKKQDGSTYVVILSCGLVSSPEKMIKVPLQQHIWEKVLSNLKSITRRRSRVSSWDLQQPWAWSILRLLIFQ